jgi:hypothetical protein
LAIDGGSFTVISLVILQFYRVRPEDHQLLPDGDAYSDTEIGKRQKPRAKKQFTLAEARGTRAFGCSPFY